MAFAFDQDGHSLQVCCVQWSCQWFSLHGSKHPSFSTFRTSKVFNWNIPKYGIKGQELDLHRVTHCSLCIISPKAPPSQPGLGWRQPPATLGSQRRSALAPSHQPDLCKATWDCLNHPFWKLRPGAWCKEFKNINLYVYFCKIYNNLHQAYFQVIKVTAHVTAW